MIKTLKILAHQGKQFIPDPDKVDLPGLHAGLPRFNTGACQESCTFCTDVCPVKAIKTNPLSLDLGKCVFCRECTSCPEAILDFTPEFRIATNQREQLIISREHTLVGFGQDEAMQTIHKAFGHSLKLRLVSDGSCNGCEMELNAADNVNFDISRYGIEFVASPRHADGLVVTGAFVRNSARALMLTWEAMAEPKLLICVGACAISGGVFAESQATDRSFLQTVAPHLYIPGCPPHPLTIIDGLLRLCGRKQFRK